MTWMRRGLLALVVAWVAACGRGTPPATNDPGDSTSEPGPQNQPPSQPPPQVISGSLKIHTRFWRSFEGAGATSAYVQLGDGLRFFKQLDTSGEVTFEDPSLVGPQDVTLVAHYENGYSQAFTYLAMERPEVWLSEPEDAPAQNPQRAFISGKVTGMGDPRGVSVYAVGKDARGYSGVNFDGSFRIQVQGTLPAVVDLLAIENDRLDPFDGKRVVGLKRGITVPAWQQVSGYEVALDHPVDQRTQLTLQGAQGYELDFSSAWLAFYQDGQYLFDMNPHGSSSFGFPSSVPTLALTAPFDTTRAMLMVNIGAAHDLPSGAAVARIPVQNSSAVTVSLPQPMALTSPTALGTWGQPAPVPPYVPDNLVFQWSKDAATQLVRFSIRPEHDYYFGQLSWTVTAPSSVTSLKPFFLRKDEKSLIFPSFKGTYRINLHSRFDGAVRHYADFFTQKPPSDPLVPTWSSSVEGSLEFQ